MRSPIPKEEVAETNRMQPLFLVPLHCSEEAAQKIRSNTEPMKNRGVRENLRFGFIFSIHFIDLIGNKFYYFPQVKPVTVSDKIISPYIFSPLSERVIEQLWWLPGIQPGSIFYSHYSEQFLLVFFYLCCLLRPIVNLQSLYILRVNSSNMKHQSGPFCKQFNNSSLEKYVRKKIGALSFTFAK